MKRYSQERKEAILQKKLASLQNMTVARLARQEGINTAMVVNKKIST